MILRPDLIEKDSLAGITVYQLTKEEEVPACHLYMEAQVFTPDSKRFILHRSAHPHGYSQRDPEHKYLLCDLEDKGRLQPFLTELGVAAPSLAPDGRHAYYFVDETEPGGKGRLLLKKAELDGPARETLLVLDRKLPGTNYRPSRIYPLSTISSDGKKLALSAFLGDGTPEHACSGLLVFDLEKCTAEVVLAGEDWINIHPQYCRSTDPAFNRDIMIQHNHGARRDEWGDPIRSIDLTGLGADIHLIRDDGTDFRDFPWGRDLTEMCQGHQCWQGSSNIAITSTITNNERVNGRLTGPYEEARLVQGLAADHQGHVGINMKNAWRNDLTKHTSIVTPDFLHFATDRAGTRLVTDSGAKAGFGIYLGRLDEAARQPRQAGDWLDINLLVRPRMAVGGKKRMHLHPFLSPDGKRVFFNSDESGLLQAYMAVLPD